MRTICLTMLLTLVLSGTGPLESQEATAGVSLPPMTTIEGTVVDEAGRPVEGVDVATVPAIDGRVFVAQSDAQGNFRLNVPAAEALSLGAFHPAFAFSTLHLPAMASTGSWTGVRLVVASGPPASGRVIDAAGRPVAGAAVTLTARKESGRLMKTPERRFTTRAGEDGVFTFDRLPPGDFVLEASAQGFASTRVSDLRLVAGQGPAELGTMLLFPASTTAAHQSR